MTLNELADILDHILVDTPPDTPVLLQDIHGNTSDYLKVALQTIVGNVENKDECVLLESDLGDPPVKLIELQQQVKLLLDHIAEPDKRLQKRIHKSEFKIAQLEQDITAIGDRFSNHSRNHKGDVH